MSYNQARRPTVTTDASSPSGQNGENASTPPKSKRSQESGKKSTPWKGSGSTSRLFSKAMYLFSSPASVGGKVSTPTRKLRPTARLIRATGSAVVAAVPVFCVEPVKAVKPVQVASVDVSTDVSVEVYLSPVSVRPESTQDLMNCAFLGSPSEEVMGPVLDIEPCVCDNELPILQVFEHDNVCPIDKNDCEFVSTPMREYAKKLASSSEDDEVAISLPPIQPPPAAPVKKRMYPVCEWDYSTKRVPLSAAFYKEGEFPVSHGIPVWEEKVVEKAPSPHVYLEYDLQDVPENEAQFIDGQWLYACKRVDDIEYSALKWPKIRPLEEGQTEVFQAVRKLDFDTVENSPPRNWAARPPTALYHDLFSDDYEDEEDETEDELHEIPEDDPSVVLPLSRLAQVSDLSANSVKTLEVQTVEQVLDYECDFDFEVPDEPRVAMPFVAKSLSMQLMMQALESVDFEVPDEPRVIPRMFTKALVESLENESDISSIANVDTFDSDQ